MRISDWSSDVCSSDLFHHRSDRLHAGQRLQARLGLARLGGLVAKAVDEGLDVAALDLLLGMQGGLPLQVLAAELLEAIVVAGVGGELAVLHVDDAVHRAVQQAAVGGAQQERSGMAVPYRTRVVEEKGVCE